MFKEWFQSKYFVDKDGKIYATDGLHEELARKICDDNGYRWRENSFYSAEDYLQICKGYIKVSNYGNSGCFKYVSYGKKFARNKKVRENAEFVASLLKVEIRTI